MARVGARQQEPFRFKLTRLQQNMLRQMLLDPVDAHALLTLADYDRASSRTVSPNDLVVEAIQPLLLEGLVSVLHFYGSSPSPFISDDTSVREILGVLEKTIASIGQPGYDSNEVDLWFELTPIGEVVASSLHEPTDD